MSAAPTMPWTEERLSAFIEKSQLRICTIVTSWNATSVNPKDWPKDWCFEHNLELELKFALTVIGDACLNGTPRPNDSYEVLANLSEAYKYKHGNAWRRLVGAVEHYNELNGWRMKHDPRLPFPCWWESRPLWEFDISEWVDKNLAKRIHPELRLLEGELDKLLESITEVHNAMEEQMSFSRRYALAAGEDIEGSSRDWAAVEAGLRTRAEIAQSGLPAFTTDSD